jgi:hypothetical protein
MFDHFTRNNFDGRLFHNKLKPSFSNPASWKTSIKFTHIYFPATYKYIKTSGGLNADHSSYKV